MPSPDRHDKLRIARLVLTQELRGLLQAPALWVLFVIVSLLVGYSFIQAVNLFSQASRTALSFPELAAGMVPLQGIFVPTFGAYYLGETLLLPFVAIRLIALDKRSGAIKLLLQLPLSTLSLCCLKMLAMGLVCLLGLLPAIVTMIFWHHLGGHIYLPGIFLLFAGHALYSLTVVAIAMFAAAITDSPSTASMFCLAITLGSWVLDFAGSSHGGSLGKLAALSLTGMLRQFENGLLSTMHTAAFLFLTALFFGLAVIWLHPGRQPLRKLIRSFAVLLVFGGALTGAMLVPGYVDMTENRIHSFSPTDTSALRKLDKRLTITVHLAPRDSRLADLEHDVLGKLRRSVPSLRVRYAKTEKSAGAFDAAGNDKYGLIEYEYDMRHEQSYSNSQEEILPIIYKLARIRVPPATAAPVHGYPLVADARASKWCFYFLLPLFFLIAGVYGWKGLSLNSSTRWRKR